MRLIDDMQLMEISVALDVPLSRSGVGKRLKRIIIPELSRVFRLNPKDVPECSPRKPHS